MRKFSILSLLPLMLLLASASATFPTAPASTESPPTFMVCERFMAVLSGADEVPPRATLARGTAMISVGGSSPGDCDSVIHVTLIVANIENVVAAHIHIGAFGTNGPVVLFLYGNAPPGGGRFDGVLSETTAGASALVGPLAGHPLSDLVDAMVAGNAYVNAHTNDGIDPTNTGPGDFPGGEVRGQIFQLRGAGGRVFST